MAKAPEWDDLEVLLRGLQEMGMVSLILCMPPDGSFLENGGISNESLALFSARIRDMAARHGAFVEAFEDHQEDPAFFADPHDHMSAKGWMYYNRALDEFYHTEPAHLEHSFARRRHQPQQTPPRLRRSRNVFPGIGDHFVSALESEAGDYRSKC